MRDALDQFPEEEPSAESLEVFFLDEEASTADAPRPTAPTPIVPVPLLSIEEAFKLPPRALGREDPPSPEEGPGRLARFVDLIGRSSRAIGASLVRGTTRVLSAAAALVRGAAHVLPAAAASVRGRTARAGRSFRAAREALSRVDVREVAIVGLCVIGLAEVGWIGLRVVTGPAEGPVQADGIALAPTTPPADAKAPAPAPSQAATKTGAPAARTGASPAAPQARTPGAPAPHVAPRTAGPASRTAGPASRTPDRASRTPNPVPRADPALRTSNPASRTDPAPRTADRGAPAAPSASGSLTISSPVTVEIFEEGRRVGTSGSGRVRLSPGRHELQIVNRPLGVDTRKAVDIVSGGSASLVVDVPPGLVNINALPWATVQVDGVAAGDTPLANLQLSAGQHEVVFSHPQLGERRMKVTVLSGKPLRLTADLRK